MKNIFKILGKKLYNIPEVLFSFFITVSILHAVGAFSYFMPLTAVVFIIPNFFILSLLYTIIYVPIYVLCMYSFSDIFLYHHNLNILQFFTKFIGLIWVLSIINPHTIFVSIVLLSYAIGLYFYLEDKYV